MINKYEAKAAWALAFAIAAIAAAVAAAQWSPAVAPPPCECATESGASDAK